jgi:3-deoxy-manno-octulosonate cytidylyltransferase (CMP-KDO synthetase)
LKSLIIIPARLASTRLPRKLLLNQTGKPLIQHTYESAQTSRLASRVLVAADDPAIVGVVQGFGGDALLTDPKHTCGTDRIAEVALKLSDYDLIVNVQGDEPELPGAAIDLALSVFAERPEANMATLATPIRDRKSLESPSCVKVVIDDQQRALYFSRAPIPFARYWDNSLLDLTPACFLQHIGLYVYRRDFLLTVAKSAPTIIETIESLEQLRVLTLGEPIHVRIIEHGVRGIDTPEDYQAFVRRQRDR